MSKSVINEELLQQIEGLQMLLKNNVAGMFGGNRKSKTYGSSCEFSDYRDYTEGDDTTKIDWNAYARFEKLYTKLYLDERQMHTRIYIDASRSMEYGDSKKAEQALRIAALLAYLSVCEMDKVSVYAINGSSVTEIIKNVVGKESYLSSIGKLNDVVFEGDCRISDAILAENVGYGDGLSVLISDFLTENDYDAAIDRFCDKKRDLVCIQVLTKEELSPLVRGKVHFFDSENSLMTYRKNIDRDIARAYKDALTYATEKVKNHTLSRAGAYLLVSADASVGEVFFEKLVNTEVLK